MKQEPQDPGCETGFRIRVAVRVHHRLLFFGPGNGYGACVCARVLVETNNLSICLFCVVVFVVAAAVVAVVDAFVVGVVDAMCTTKNRTKIPNSSISIETRKNSKGKLVEAKDVFVSITVDGWICKLSL